MSSRPSCSALSFTVNDPGTIIALTLAFTFLSLTIEATDRKSSIRELVQEPIKTLSKVISLIGVFG